MQRLMTALVAIIWGAVLIGTPFRPTQSSNAADTQARVGHPAPALTAVGINGLPVALSDLRGKAVFLNFWASWCGPCLLEMPEIQRLAETLPPGTAILTVNMTDSESSPEAVRRFVAAKGYTFPVALDPEGTAGRTYGVLSLPTSLFITPEGVVTARISGPLSYVAMVDYLQAAGR